MSRAPSAPGVYIFLGEGEKVIYVGKAKNLRRRLASYFVPETGLSPKTRAMLGRAVSLDTISTATNNEALLLEAGLIKKHRPHYNIILRDDKEYQLFRLDLGAPYPRLEIARRVKSGKNGGERIFGPFSSGRDAKNAWKAIHRAFPLRRCSDRAMKNRSRPCLYYHLRQCLGPCVFAVPQELYMAMTRKVILLLEGRTGELLPRLRAEMGRASERQEYEKAALLRDQIRAVESIQERQYMVLKEARDMDVLGLAENERGLCLGLLIVRGGCLLGSRNYFWPGLELEDAEELFAGFLLQYYARAELIPPLVILPWTAESSGEDDGFNPLETAPRLSELRGARVRIAHPRPGQEAELSGLAAANARDYARRRQEDKLPALLAAAFNLKTPVERVEVVDISHISGHAARAGLVVFEQGQPLRSAWRAYTLGEDRGDDYAALASWAGRRAQDGPPWPDLLLIDGGRGQLGAVRKIFAQHDLEGAFALAAIAKARDACGRSDRRAGNVEDQIFIPGRSNPLNIKAGSQEMLFLQHIRNHAHDFVLGRHRKARAGAALRGELESIPGFGPVFARRLWEKFDSLRAMAEADDEALGLVAGLGRERVKALRAHLARIIDRDKS